MRLLQLLMEVRRVDRRELTLAIFILDGFGQLIDQSFVARVRQVLNVVAITNVA